MKLSTLQIIQFRYVENTFSFHYLFPIAIVISSYTSYTTMTTKTMIMTSLASTVLVLTIGIAPAYALESNYDTGPYTEYGSNPAGTSGGSYGDADTYGNGELKSTAAGLDGTTNASAFWNIDSSGNDGDDPDMTTSAGTIYFGADYDFDIDNTKGTFGSIEFKTGGQLHKIVNNNPIWQKTCLISTITTSGNHDQVGQTYCNKGGYSGTSEFITEGITTTRATTPIIGTNEVDANTGNLYTDITELVLCDYDCGNS